MKKLLISAAAAMSALCGFSGIDGFITGSSPDTYTSTVTNVRSYAFAGHRTIKKISLPSAVEVGPAAFIGCVSLEALELPSVVKLDSFTGIFSGCPKLRTVNLSSVDYNREKFPRFPWGANYSVRFTFRNGVFKADGTRVY